MSYWKTKLLPKLKKLLHKGPKAQAAEACRSFNKSKDVIAKEIEENKEVLQPKMAAIYHSSSDEAKSLLKEPTESGVIESFEVVQNLLIELSNAGCPGAHSLSEATVQHGTTRMSKAIVFLLSKLTTFVVAEGAPEYLKSEKQEIDLATTKVDVEEVHETREPTPTTVEPALMSSEATPTRVEPSPSLPPNSQEPPSNNAPMLTTKED